MEQPEFNETTVAFLVFCLKAVIVIVAVSLGLNYVLFTRIVNRWKKSGMPFLRPTFLLGHKCFINRGQHSLLVKIDQLYRENENKDLVAFFMLTTPVVLVKDPSLIRWIFSKHFSKTYQNILKPLKNDIETQNTIGFASDITQWKKGRAFLAPAFAETKLHDASAFATLKKQIDKVLRHSEKAEVKGQPIDVFEVSRNFIIDFISLWGLGEDQDSFQKKTKFHELARNFFGTSPKRMIKFLITVHFPFLQYFKTFQFIEPQYKEFFKNILKKQQKHRQTFNLYQNDAINHILSLRQEDLVGTNEKNSNDFLEENEGVRMRGMVGYSLALFLGATSTPPLVIVYILHLLSLYPEYQDRIKEEIDATLAKHQVTEFTPEVIEDLNFTKQCILESERLFPLTSIIYRRCSDDIQLPGRTFSLKKGEAVIISPYSMHHDPKYFKDPEKFDPERFSPQNIDSIPPEIFVAFGYGPKKCPGFQQGNFMATFFVAALVQKYEMQPHSHFKQMDATDAHPTALSTHPRTDLFVKLVRRESVAI